MISVEGARFPRRVILHAIFFHVRHGVSYRDLEQILAERGVQVDHATLNRWVIRYAPLVAGAARKRKTRTVPSWRMGDTHVKVRGRGCYLYRAVDRDGQSLDFILSEEHDMQTAELFLAKAIPIIGLPDRCAIDKSGANTAALEDMNGALRELGSTVRIRIMQSKSLTEVVEQDHRFVKCRMRPVPGLKSTPSPSATLGGSKPRT